jgi:hypothetical protein
MPGVYARSSPRAPAGTPGVAAGVAAAPPPRRVAPPASGPPPPPLSHKTLVALVSPCGLCLCISGSVGDLASLPPIIYPCVSMSACPRARVCFPVSVPRPSTTDPSPRDPKIRAARVLARSAPPPPPQPPLFQYTIPPRRRAAHIDAGINGGGGGGGGDGGGGGGGRPSSRQWASAMRSRSSSSTGFHPPPPPPRVPCHLHAIVVGTLGTNTASKRGERSRRCCTGAPLR